MTKEEKPHAGDRQDQTMTEESTIFFDCDAGLSCFTTCCRDVTIFLTPYDVLRMKRALAMTSEEFLERYTRTLIPRSTGLPVLQLKMNEAEDKRCFFVDAGGCTIYGDRPWACRMYPLDKREDDQGYVFIAGAEICHGRRSPKSWKVHEWLTAQGLQPYEEMEFFFQRMTLNKRLLEEGVSNPRLQSMYRMACYDLDTFRRFVFESRFLKIFDVDPVTVEEVRTSDEALLLLALRWLQFGFVAGDALPIKQEIMEAETSRRAHGKESTLKK